MSTEEETTQARVQEDLRQKERIREEIRVATDDIMGRMRELADTLNSVASASDAQQGRGGQKNGVEIASDNDTYLKDRHIH